MRVIEYAIYTSDIYITSSLFTFVFDCEIERQDDVTRIILNDGLKIQVLEAPDVSNVLVLKMEDFEVQSLSSKIELFNFKYNCNLEFNGSEILLDKSVIVSVI